MPESYALELVGKHAMQVQQGQVMSSSAAWTWLSTTKHTPPYPADFPIKAAVVRKWDELKGKGAAQAAPAVGSEADDSEADDDMDEVKVTPNI